MYRWLIKGKSKSPGWAIKWASLFLSMIMIPTSCGFIDLRPISVSTTPNNSGAVLATSDTPLIIHFGTEMEKRETEKVLSVTGMAGQINGDLYWKGNDLYFLPLLGWSPGIRYTMSLSGTIYSTDGRDLRLSKHIPFYAVSKSEIPIIISFSPSFGESVGVTADDGGMVSAVFSCAMDRRTTEDAFSWDCPGEKVFEWFDNDTRLEVKPKDTLAAWSSYRWSFTEAALSTNLAPLLTAYTSQFVTDKDTLMPEVVRTFPMAQSGFQWLDTGGSLVSDLGAKQAIGIEFNKPMDRDTAIRSVSLSPSVSGRTEQLTESSVIFIPEGDLQPETLYTLTISKDTKDKTGLKLGEEYREYFTPDIPYLEVVSISIDGHPLLTGDDLKNGTSHAIQLTTPEVLRLSIVFSLSLTNEAIMDIASRISLDVYFPLILDPISLRAVESSSTDSVTFVWEGLKNGTTDVRNFYRLSIPGGKGGIINGAGSYFKEDCFLYFEVVP